MEKKARFSGGEISLESCHVSGCHGFSVLIRGRCDVFHVVMLSVHSSTWLGCHNRRICLVPVSHGRLLIPRQAVMTVDPEKAEGRLWTLWSDLDLSETHRCSGKKKAHKRKLFGPVALGTTPGLSQVCPRDKPTLSQGQTQVFSLFYTMEAQFVPGTNPVVPGTSPGTKGGRKVCVVKVYVPFSLLNVGAERRGRGDAERKCQGFRMKRCVWQKHVSTTRTWWKHAFLSSERL